MTHANLASFFIEINKKLTCDDGVQVVEKMSLQIFIGKLIYLSTTRTNIIYAINLINQYMQSNLPHVKAAQRILWCPKGTKNKGL